jgi:prevent-host-death family protein
MPSKRVRKHVPGRAKKPEAVSATVFKDSCLQLIERVRQTREEIVVTKYGRPVAKLVAFRESNAPLFGFLEGSVTIAGDIVGPVGETWDADG